jgi:hypothetical protein
VLVERELDPSREGRLVLVDGVRVGVRVRVRWGWLGLGWVRAKVRVRVRARVRASLVDVGPPPLHEAELRVVDQVGHGTQQEVLSGASAR